MGQSTSEILDELCFEMHMLGQKCQLVANRLHGERDRLYLQARGLVKGGADKQRTISILRRVAQKEKEALRWETTASQLNNLKHQVMIAGVEAEVTKEALRLCRAVKRAIPHQRQQDLELLSLDDDLEALGAGGRELMEGMGSGGEVDVTGMLEQLEAEASVAHDLPPAPIHQTHQEGDIPHPLQRTR